MAGALLNRPAVSVTSGEQSLVFVADVLWDYLSQYPVIRYWTSDPTIVVSPGESGVGENPTTGPLMAWQTEPSQVIDTRSTPLPVSRDIWITREYDGPTMAEILRPRGAAPLSEVIRISPSGMVALHEHAESDGAFWSGFARGAVVWAAVVAATVYTAGALNSTSVAGVAGAGGAEAAATEWALATDGMATGMGSGGLVSGTGAGTLTLGGVQSGVQQIAQTATAIRTTANLVTGTGTPTDQNPVAGPGKSLSGNSTVFLVAALAALLGMA